MVRRLLKLALAAQVLRWLARELASHLPRNP
jgi:hypothetical protein